MFPNNGDFESKVSLESEKSGVVEDIPFRLLILGDFSGDGDKKDVSTRYPLEIDRDNFEEILIRLKAKVELDIFGNDSNTISLQFNELDDFHPDNIFRQIPLFSDLRDIRRRLLDPKSYFSAESEIRSWLNPTESVSTEVAIDEDDLLNRILSGKSEAETVQISHSKELNLLLRELVRPHLVSIDENEQTYLLSVIDESTSNLMRKILHNPKFQKLESTWRGLSFLLKRVETDVNLKVYILNVSKTEIADNLKEANDLTKTFLYRRLISDAPEILGEHSWTLTCGLYDFEPNIDDIAALIRLAKIASIANTPFISNITAEVLGINSLAETPDSENWDLSDETKIGKLWSALRSIQESEFLGLTITKFLARLPFGSETDPIDSFSFEEFAEQPVHNQYLWANSALVCALLLCQSFSKYEWEMGQNLNQNIDGLPIHIYKDNSETIMKPCAEVVLTQNSCEKLMEFGLMPLLSYRNTDRVRLARFQSIANPVTSLRGKWVKENL